MSDVKWIKIVVDIFDDEKILLIEQMPDADSLIVIWFKLLCLAGKQNNSGVLMINEIPCTDEMLAAIFRRPLNTVKLALDTFERYGMIEIINGCVTIPNWGKHQSLEGLEQSRELTRRRVASFRERQKLKAAEEGCNVTERYSNVTVTPTDIDKDIDTDKEEDKNNNGNAKPRKRFVAPTLEEVKAYCRERNNHVDAERWMSFYESNGWKVGRNPMRNWKAAVRTWESNGIDKGKPAKENPALNYEQREYSDDDYKSGDYMNEAREFMERMKKG